MDGCIYGVKALYIIPISSIHDIFYIAHEKCDTPNNIASVQLGVRTDNEL